MEQEDVYAKWSAKAMCDMMEHKYENHRCYNSKEFAVLPRPTFMLLTVGISLGFTLVLMLSCYTVEIWRRANEQMKSLVEFEQIDLQPCGGTHVARSGEIGEVRVSKIEKKGKQNRRVIVEFA